MAELPKGYEPFAKAAIKNLCRRGYRLIGPAGTEVTDVVLEAPDPVLPSCSCMVKPYCDVHDIPSEAYMRGMDDGIRRMTGDLL